LGRWIKRYSLVAANTAAWIKAKWRIEKMKHTMRGHVLFGGYGITTLMEGAL
jgi:hypothetical protein